MFKNFRTLARYNVLTPVAMLGFFATSGLAYGVDQVIASGTTISNTVVLGNGDSLTNAGTINPPNASGVGYPGNGAGGVQFILNSATGQIIGTNQIGIGIDGTLGRFENHGVVTTNQNSGLGVSGTLGEFINDGSIISTDNSGVGVGGLVGSFSNNGLISGARYNAIYFDKGVTTFVNGTAGVIRNTSALNGGGDGVDFNTDLNTGGAVTSFTNNGSISADLASTEGSGVAFFDNSNNNPNAFQVGSFVNTGTISGAGNGVFARGGFAAFNNSGTIIGAKYSAVGSGGLIGSFNNSGLISSSGETGFSADGSVGTFTNSGTIEGKRFNAAFFDRGVGSFLNDTSGIIRNTGAMGEDGTGIQFQTDLNDGGAVGSFVNRGLITADMASVEGNGVGFNDHSNNDPNAFQTMSFFNAGTITGVGNGVFSRGGFQTFGNSGIITGIRYSGVTSQSAIGTFSNSGTISSIDGTGATFEAGVGQFSNTGTIASINDQGAHFKGAVGSFANSGSITSGQNRAVEFQQLVGAFTNSGTIISKQNGVSFGAGFGNASNSGTILSTAATGEIGVRIDEAGGTFTNTGTIQGSAGVVYILNNAGANTFVNAGTLRGTDGAAIAFDGGADSDDVLKLLTGSKVYGDISFGAGTDTLDFSGFSGNTVLRVYGFENINAGDRLYAYDQPSDTVAIVEKTGVIAPTAQVTQDIAAQIQSVIAGQLSTAITGSADEDDSALGYAAAPVPTAAAAAIEDAQVAPSGVVWGSLIGGGSRDDLPVALSSLFGGIVAGSHAQLVPGTTLGIVGSYIGSSVDVNVGGQTVQSQTGVLGVYGKTEVNIAELNYSLIGGFANNHSQRNMLTLGVPQTAVADYSSWFLAPSIGASLPVLSSDRGELKVAAQVGYIGGQVAGYTETGSGMNLIVGTQSVSLLDARLGLEATLDGGSTGFGETKFRAKGGIFLQSNMGGSSTPVTVLGQAQNVALAGTTNYGLYAGAGLSIPVSSGINIDVSVDGQVGNDGMLSGAGKAGLVGAF